MRTTLADGRAVQIRFRHTHFKEPSPGPHGRRIRAVTTCQIAEAPTAGVRAEELAVFAGPVIANGAAECSWSDQFRKEIGRQTALRRAVAELAQPDRGKVLQAYFGRCRRSRREV